MPLNRARQKRLTSMAVKAILLGQVWRSNADGQNYLVTKIYNELFTQYAMMRAADTDASQAETVRVKVTKNADSVALPGYTYTQESQDF
jgi:hypothetical protein